MSAAKIKRYVSCPTCNTGEHFIEHLFGRWDTKKEFTWYCENSDCGYAFTVSIGPGEAVSVQPETKRRKKKLVLLRIPPQRDSIYLIVEGRIFDDGEPIGSNDRYFYEEHTCPTNVTRDIKEMIVGSDTDPHGIFEYLATVPYREWDYGPRTWEELTEMFAGAIPIPPKMINV